MNQLEYYMSKPKDFLVKKHSSKDLYIVSYKHLGIDWSLPYALDARGIVLDGESNVIARPYRKFFNYGELRSREDLFDQIKDLSEWEHDEDFVVYEKLDGSLVTVFTYEDKLYYASSGSLQGRYPHKFKMWFDKNLTKGQRNRLKELGENYTLLFEYVSPKDRIVVKYHEDQMILHGIIETKTGREIHDDKMIKAIANALGVDTPNIFDIDFERLMNIKSREWGENVFEGFVVKFESGKRLKVKTDEYVELHPLYTMGFGELNTKRKIEAVAERVKNNDIDDLIAVFEDRKDKRSLDMIYRVIELSNNFDVMLLLASDIVKDKDFTKRHYAMNNDPNDTLSQIVFNIDKPEKIDKFRLKYIKDELEREMEK